MIPELIVTALLVGWLLRGRFARLAEVRIRYGWMIFVPLGMYLAAHAVNYSHVFPRDSWVFGAAHMVGLMAVMVVTFANRAIPGVKLMFAGVLANAVAIVSNGGLMPVWKPAARAIWGEALFNKILSDPHVRHAFTDNLWARLNFLGDVIAARRPFFLCESVYSIGDVILSLGGLIAIVAIMRTPLPLERRLAGGT